MGQSGYAQTFVNLMLGWIRQLASGIAGMFQSTGTSQASTGASMVAWFADNWIKLLIALIVLGVLIDWIVWMLRWRPYWLWFRKRRVLLNDDPMDESPEPPHFESAARRRDDPYYDEASDWDEDGSQEEPEFFDPDLDDEPFDAYDPRFDDDDESDEEAVLPLSLDEDEDGDEPDEMPLVDSAPDEADDWDDAPRKKNARFFGRRAARALAPAEDPFAVDDEDFSDLDDDDFAAALAQPPQPLTTDGLSLYARPLTAEESEEERKLSPIEDADSGDYDERIGYQSDFEPVTGTGRSRKSRRQKQEAGNDFREL